MLVPDYPTKCLLIFFLKTFAIIGLAIAFVIGQAASALVNAFVKDIIDPFIGLFLQAGSLSALTVVFSMSIFIER
jgi:large-conductance mechanosensitive channel